MNDMRNKKENQHELKSEGKSKLTQICAFQICETTKLMPSWAK